MGGYIHRATMFGHHANKKYQVSLDPLQEHKLNQEFALNLNLVVILAQAHHQRIGIVIFRGMEVGVSIQSGVVALKVVGVEHKAEPEVAPVQLHNLVVLHVVD